MEKAMQFITQNKCRLQGYTVLTEQDAVKLSRIVRDETLKDCFARCRQMLCDRCESPCDPYAPETCQVCQTLKHYIYETE